MQLLPNPVIVSNDTADLTPTTPPRCGMGPLPARASVDPSPLVLDAGATSLMLSPVHVRFGSRDHSLAASGAATPQGGATPHAALAQAHAARMRRVPSNFSVGCITPQHTDFDDDDVDNDAEPHMPT